MGYDLKCIEQKLDGFGRAEFRARAALGLDPLKTPAVGLKALTVNDTVALDSFDRGTKPAERNARGQITLRGFLDELAFVDPSDEPSGPAKARRTRVFDALVEAKSCQLMTIMPVEEPDPAAVVTHAAARGEAWATSLQAELDQLALGSLSRHSK